MFKMLQALALGSFALVAIGCIEETGTTDQFAEINDLTEVEQALIWLPNQPIIYTPGHGQYYHEDDVPIQWDRVGDATQYRIQITRASSFNAGDSCPAPCEYEGVISSNTMCPPSDGDYCLVYHNDSYVAFSGDTGERRLRIRGGKPGVGGFWSATRYYNVY